MKCKWCKKEKENVTSKTLWLCDDCIQAINKDYISMLKRKEQKGISVTKELNEFIDKIIL